MDYNTVLTEKQGHIGIISMNNPPYHVMNFQLLSNIHSAFIEMGGDSNIRAVILTGTGDKCFSRGFDIAMAGQYFKQRGLDVPAAYDEPLFTACGPLGHSLFRKIELFPKPVIAAINGIALGGGSELAAACHLRVMVDDGHAFIGQEEVKIGIIPGWGGCQRLARLLGRTRALEMILTYKKLYARQAYEWGLVNQVSEPGQVMQDALDLAANICEAHLTPLSAALNAVIQGADSNMSHGIYLEQLASDSCWATDETLKLLAEFVNRGEDQLYSEHYDFKWAKTD